MAVSSNIIPFIKGAEGGWVNNPDDQGGETNKGITYATWEQFFGDTHDRFMAMSDADWAYIFLHGYWNAILGNQINSQAIADFLVDWYWGSGTYAVRHLQQVLNDLGYAVSIDGAMGPQTLAAVNAADPQTLLDALNANKAQFYQSIVDNDPSQAQFLQGWMNRLNSLYAQVSSYIGDIATPGTSAVLLFFCLVSLATLHIGAIATSGNIL